MDATTQKMIDDQLNSIRQMPAVMSKEERQGKDIKSVYAGGYIEIDDVVYFVEDRSSYKEKKWQWYELKLVSLLDGKIMFLEWEQDDTLELAMWNGDKIKFDDLGIIKTDLDRFDDTEKGQLTYAGELYVYDESDEAIWYQGMTGKGIKSYYYDFCQKNSTKLISVEKWEDGSYEVSVGYKVSPNRVEILVLGNKT